MNDDPAGGSGEGDPAPANVELTLGQLEALRNLARKSAKEDVAFINIAHARALTELGLAERNREGWNITFAGHSVLKARDARDARNARADNDPG